MQKHLECPVCFELLERVVQCKKGHSVCITCSGSLKQCPMCREVYTGTRNYALEDVIRDFKELKMISLQMAEPEKKAVPLAAKASAAPVPKRAPTPVYLCRVLDCEVSLPLSQLYVHLRNVHGSWIDEYYFIFNEVNSHFALGFKDFPIRNASKYINIRNYGLFVIFFRVKTRERSTKCSCWIQKVASTDIEAKRYSFTVMTDLSKNRKAEYSDYMHGEQSTEADILSTKTCFIVHVSSRQTTMDLYLDIFMTTRGLDASRCTKTELYKT